MNILFKNNNERKIRRCDINIHKDMQITVNLYQKNRKFFVTVQPKNACKLGFIDHLWLPFLDQPQSDIVFFEIMTFQIYNILVTKCKHGICPNDIISFK